ncbi:LysR family transcriptional regulator [Paraburkholderia sp. CNPSo 3272]|uniref:LysR family transcriptional regulator n=1 Tax=Paraburkholderia sp. CNPSo 3272 TaxID=2940931 RepID=UPI0020B6892E|nr:LysR family transcriptional regulator [Paraburkholderia sp. CNPSo 3272]MCP3728543.1 LysR family transcriptional regulator [Paraburkholderia sp. CNPSo 3272]
MDLNLIRLFIEIVDSKSLSAAARKLGVTRSNISHRLKQLERETGAQLLRRSTRELDLTDAGHAMYDGGRRMLEQLSATRSRIDSLGKTLSGHIRISVPTGFGRMFVGPMLLEFMCTHPDVTLTVVFNNRIHSLIAAQVDVALKITLQPPEECVARYVCPIHWRLFASPTYFQKHGPIETPADLESRVLVGSPYRGQTVTLKLLPEGDASGEYTVALPAILQSADFPLLTEAVSRGIGIGLLPDYAAHAPGYEALQPILPGYRVAEVGGALYILTLPNRYPSPSTRALIDYLRDSIASLAGTWV